MSLSVNKVEKEALKLNKQDRAKLVQKILNSLDLAKNVDTEISEEWISEIILRKQDITEKKIRSLPLSDVLSELRKSTS